MHKFHSFIHSFSYVELHEKINYLCLIVANLTVKTLSSLWTGWEVWGLDIIQAPASYLTAKPAKIWKMHIINISSE